MLSVPQLTLFNLANILLGLTLAVLFARYLWITYIHKEDTPVLWEHALKRGEVDPRLKKLERRYRDRQRFYAWWLQAERLKREKVPGVFAELGVYKGASAEVIHQMDPGRPFHLFDTFSGFTAGDLKEETGEAATYTTDHFSDTSREKVLRKINGNHNIIIHPGYFPATAVGFKEQVALVNIDADLYLPTKAGLELFYPLLAPGGVIFIHDCNPRWPGIVKAVSEFASSIPETPVLLPDREGTVLIVKLGPHPHPIPQPLPQTGKGRGPHPPIPSPDGEGE